MARLPRLVIPGLAHYVLLRGHSGARVLHDAADEDAFLDALQHSLDGAEIALHAFALRETEVHLLLRPHSADILGRTIQTLGRRYVSAFNLRHGRSGTLWDGRYRAAVVEPGEMCLFALRRVERLAAGHAPLPGDAERQLAWRRTLLNDPPELWALGNTPFEREAAYRQLLVQELAPTWLAALDAAVLSGRVFGTPTFVSSLSRDLQRPLHAARPGRPALHVRGDAKKLAAMQRKADQGSA